MVNYLTVLVLRVYTHTSLSTLTVKALLNILPKRSLITSRNTWKKEQHEDAAHKAKNHENKSLMGPLKSLGAPGKYSLFPPLPSRWA